MELKSLGLSNHSVEQQEHHEDPAILELKQELHRKFSEYFERHDSTIDAYMQGAGIPVRCKEKGWFVHLDRKDVYINADPTFFLEKGYNEDESLWATFHEIEHFLDMARDPESYETAFAMIASRSEVHPSYSKQLGRFLNCLDDILVNNRVDERWSKATHVRVGLYAHKLFSRKDFKKEPLARQFMYTFLREAMLPHEKCEVAPEVRSAVDELKEDVLYMTSVKPYSAEHMVTPDQRFLFFFEYMEPVFREFFLKDVENHNQKKEEASEEKGEKSEDGDPFENDPFEDAIPDPLEFDDVLEKCKEFNAALQQKKRQDFEETVGVKEHEFKAYSRDLHMVEPYIDSMVDTFECLLEEKLVQIRKKISSKEGLLHSGKVGIAYTEMQAGNLEPEVFTEVRMENLLTLLTEELELTLVADGSGSMGHGGKLAMQRKVAILFIEAFERLRERLMRKVHEGIMSQALKISTEVRMFSDEDVVIKKLSHDPLELKDKVRIRKQLIDIPGQGNNEPATLNALRDNLDEDIIQKLISGKLKKIIIFLTDGETDEGKVRNGMKQIYAKAGQGAKNLVIAGIGFDEGVSAANTYAPNGFYADSFEHLIQIVEKILKNIISSI